MTIIEHANENFKRIIAPLCNDKRSLGGRYEKSDRKGVIIGHWHEDGNTYEITCPERLRDSLIELLNNVHLLELKEEI